MPGLWVGRPVGRLSPGGLWGAWEWAAVGGAVCEVASDGVGVCGGLFFGEAASWLVEGVAFWGVVQGCTPVAPDAVAGGVCGECVGEAFVVEFCCECGEPVQGLFCDVWPVVVFPPPGFTEFTVAGEVADGDAGGGWEFACIVDAFGVEVRLNNVLLEWPGGTVFA